MDKFVLNVFKGIMISMIMIFAFDMLSYLYRALSINQKMLNIMTGMQRVVMENNYMPKEMMTDYEGIFNLLAENYNSSTGVKFENGSDDSTFLHSVKLNYGQDAEGDFSGIDNTILVKDMRTPGEYGDIAVVQATIKISQPVWGFNVVKNSLSGAERSANNFNREGVYYNTLSYTYLVPCLHYQRI